jgi:hypothetical protein
MTDTELIKSKLENFPDFRERRFRGKFLVILALRETGLEVRHKDNQIISHDELSDFAIKYDSLRHAWGEVTRDNIELRGKDWADGKNLAQEKQLEYGYQPMNAVNQKELNKI